MIVRELLTRLGFQADDRAAKKYESSLKSVKIAAAATVAAATSIGTSALAAARKTAVFGDELDKTGTRLGINTDRLQELRFAAERSGVGVNTITMAMQRMTRRVGEAAEGGGEAKDAIKELGLNAKQLARLTPDEQMRAFADALSGVKSQSDRVRLAFKLFDSEGVALLQMIENGSAGLDEYTRRFHELGGGISEEGVKQSARFMDTLTDVGIVMKSITFTIGERLMPAMSDTIGGFLDWFAANSQIIRQNIGAAIEKATGFLSRMSGVIMRVVGVGTDLITFFMESRKNALLVAGAVATIAMRFGFLRRMIGSFIAFLVIDDIAAWVQGQESLIGNLIGSYESVVTALQPVIDAFGGLEGALQLVVGVGILKWLSTLATAVMAHPILALVSLLAAGALLVIQNWGKIKEFFEPLLDWLGEKFDWVLGKIKPLIDGLKFLKDKGASAVSAVTGFFGGNDEETVSAQPDRGRRDGRRTTADIMPGVQEIIAPQPLLPASSFIGAPATIGGNTTNTSSVTANVTVGLPPGAPATQRDFVEQEVLPVIRQEIEDAARTATSNFPRAE